MDERNIIWIDGFLYENENAKIHILTHSLHYGTAVFEGIRCYKTQKGLAIFRLEDHLKRLFESAKIYFMNIEYSMKELEDAIINTIKKNGLDECYVRPLVYFGHGKMGVYPLNNKVSVPIVIGICTAPTAFFSSSTFSGASLAPKSTVFSINCFTPPPLPID